MRTASTFKPDSNLEGVAPEDIQDIAIENRHIGDGEITPDKMGAGAVTEVKPLMNVEIEIDADASAGVDKVTAPFAMKVVDIVVQAKATVGGGTVQVKNDGTAINPTAIAMATDTAITRAADFTAAETVIAKDAVISVITANTGDRGTVNLICQPV
jgi:hypothetical protein